MPVAEKLCSRLADKPLPVNFHTNTNFLVLQEINKNLQKNMEDKALDNIHNNFNR